jgi:ankyrin repeat protein
VIRHRRELSPRSTVSSGIVVDPMFSDPERFASAGLLAGYRGLTAGAPHTGGGRSCRDAPAGELLPVVGLISSGSTSGTSSAQIRQSVGVTKAARPLDGSDDDALLALFRAVASGKDGEVRRRLDAAPALASRGIRIGASREDPVTYFLATIHHYVYAGDTALHVAAAAHRRDLAESLVSRGADVRARNRRGGEPLHYAADGSPGARGWDRSAQREVIAYLVDAGADPDTRDKSGVAPLHRAVRTRSADAVAALMEHGANATLMNGSGSTPLHLAVQNTGKSNSGSDAAKEEQRRIIATLLQYGASPTDVDANGKSVADAAASDWIRQLLKR